MSDTDTAREEIACELQNAQQALDRAVEIGEETRVLTRVERENLTIPMGRIKSVQNELPDCSNTSE